MPPLAGCRLKSPIPCSAAQTVFMPHLRVGPLCVFLFLFLFHFHFFFGLGSYNGDAPMYSLVKREDGLGLDWWKVERVANISEKGGWVGGK